MPPWPEITILPGGGIEYESDPESCTTESASICSTTTFYSVTIEPTATVTTFTSTSQTCATVFGCDVTNSDSATTVTSASDCPATPTSKPPNGCPQNAVVYPANPTSVGQIPTLLEKYASTYEVVGLPSFDFVSFYWVPLLDQQTMDTLKASSDVSDAYYYEDFYANVGYAPNEMDDQEEASLAFRDIKVRGPAYSHDMWLKNESAVGHSKTNVNLVGDMEDISPQSALSRRAGTAEIQKTNYFELSQISLAPGQVWKTGESNSGSISSILGFITSYNYLYDASAGAGQHTYILNEHLVWETHPVSFMRWPGGVFLQPRVHFALDFMSNANIHIGIHSKSSAQRNREPKHRACGPSAIWASPQSALTGGGHIHAWVCGRF